MQPLSNAPCPTSRAALEGTTASPMESTGPDEAPPFDEWHTLLLAVRTRLRSVLECWPMVDSTPQQHAAAMRSRATAMDCADALDQLHDTLIAHDHLHRRLIFDLQQARAELARRTTEP